MKKIFFAALGALLIAGCTKERETPEPTPPPTPDEELYDVYLTGQYWIDDTEISCYFKNGERHDLAFPDDGLNYYTQAIALHDGKVYVTVGEADGKTSGYCIDGVWHANEMPDRGRTIRNSHSIGFLDGSVYMAAYYLTETMGHRACYWKDGVCRQLIIPNVSGYAVARSLAVSGGSVYIAGEAKSGEIAGYWKDEVWNPLTIPDGYSTAYLRGIACSEGSVYVTGRLDSKQTCLWVDGVAQILSGSGDLRFYGEKIAVADGKVYVAGYYSDKNNNYSHVGYWQDGVLHKLDAPGNESYLYDIKVVDGSVFIAGGYYTDEQEKGCYWKDGVRVDIPTTEGMNSSVTGIDVVKKQ